MTVNVTIGGTEIIQENIIDFNRIKRNIISVPKWINSAIDLDTNVYVRKLPILEYIVRMTDLEKYFWEQKMLAHQLYTLTDYIHNIFCYVWISSIESEWSGNENNSNPWKITMELLTVNLETILDWITFYDGYCSLPVTISKFPFGYINLQVDMTKFSYFPNNLHHVFITMFSTGGTYEDMTGVEESFTKYEHQDNLDIYLAVYGNIWKAQSFSPSTTHHLRYVVLNLSQPLGELTGNVIVSIKATDVDGYPTGDDLVSATIPASNIPVSPTDMSIYFSSFPTLTASTKYAIVIHCSGGDVSHYLNVGFITTGGYSDGEKMDSNDGGTTWSHSSSDIKFEEWGYV